MRNVSPERWRQIEELFDRVADLPPERRLAFLDEHCAADTELRSAVEALLAESELDTPLPASMIGAGAALPPRRVGPYRIEGELGQGGMGTVYLAERDDEQFRKRVAVKLLRRGFASDELTRRFRHERQILANLDHPHIARLLDGGVADGAPYLVMEYVDGLPLDTFSERNRLPLADRIQLFTDVCAAVEYAHQNLVVHRDLKPSNILVTADRQVKLLDFGIAKLLDQGDGESPLTRTGVHVMTPEYAAPEQVRAGPVTTATDVYALGVLLYELLVGQRPYELEGRSLSEIERVICETEPVRPSTALRRREPPVPAARRRHDRLRRKLRGDLDTIVMKALRKDPRRRYPSAAAMLDDLRRYRQGRPVLARPDRAGYRARKFALRHKAGVAVGLLLLGAAAGFVVRETQLRREAEVAAARAAAVRDYLAGVFQVSDPFGIGSLRGEDVTARTLLERGVERADNELGSQPEARAEMLGVLGSVYTNLGLLTEAEPLLQRSLDQRLMLYGARHSAVAEAMDALAGLRLQQGRLDEAEAMAREALMQRRTALGRGRVETAQSLDRLATVLQERSDYAQAEPLFREALAIRERLLGPDHADVAQSLNNLGLLLYLLGRTEEAEALYRQSHEVFRRALGDEHPRTLATLGNIAQVLQARGELREAERYYRESLALKRTVLGDAHPGVTVQLSNLGVLLRDLGDLDESARLISEALALDRQIFGDEHPFVAANLTHLAATQRDRGRFDDAEASYQEALELNRRLLGEEHARVLQARQGLAVLRQRRGDLSGAETEFRASRELALRLFDPDHVWVVSTDVGLGMVLQARGRHDDAEPLLRRIVDDFSLDDPSIRGFVITAHVGLGQVLAARGELDDALALLLRALDASRVAFGHDHWRSAEPALAAGQVLARQDRPAEAQALLLEARAALSTSPVALPVLDAALTRGFSTPR